VTFEPGAAGFSLKTDLITALKNWIDGPVPRRPDRSVVVGARGFELQTSCAQGRRSGQNNPSAFSVPADKQRLSRGCSMCLAVRNCAHLSEGWAQKLAH
jgi:hypothetical protein